MADLTRSDELKPGRDEKELTVAEVKDVLARLIVEGASGYPYPHGMDVRDTKWRLINALAISLPKEFRYESVLTNMDRRSLYAQVMAPDPSGSKSWNGKTYDPAMRELAARWFTANNDMVAEQAEALARAEGITDDEQIRQVVNDATTLKGRTNVTRAPEVVLRERLEQLGPSAGNPAQPRTLAEVVEQFRTGGSAGLFNAEQAEKIDFLTPADVRAMFRFSDADSAIRQMIDYDDSLSQFARDDQIGGQQLPPNQRVVWTEDDEPSTTYVPPSMFPQGSVQSIEYQRRLEKAADKAKGVRSYTVNEAANLLWTMDSKQLRQVQQQLLNAGYYDTEEGATFRGDPTDSETQAAWRRAIADSVRSGTPMVELMRRRATEMRAAKKRERDKIAQEMQPLSDPAGIRVRAGELARDLLGRTTQPEEAEAIVEFIHGLQRDRGERLASERPGFVTDVNVDAQIEEYLSREFPLEKAGHDAADEYELFTRMLAGPGRPG